MQETAYDKRRSLQIPQTDFTPHPSWLLGASNFSASTIYPAKVANIEVADADGQIKRRLCILPAADLPVWDVLAAQLLHLQDPAMESHFIARANVFPVYFGKICFDR